jgi:TIR domain-containing protein
MSDLSLFVSHVSEDRAAAMALVEELEKRGVRCWIAPRNIRPGRPFDDEIAAAIEACRAMLLVFSERCNESEYIRREVTVAGESQKIVIPFRIENAQPKRGLRVRLSDLNWIDGFVSRENAIDELVSNFKAQDDQQRLDTDVRHRQQAEAEQGRQRDEAAERQRLEEQQRQSAAEALRQSEQERAALEARQRQEQEGREKAVAAQATADVGSKDDKTASEATAKKSFGSVAAWIGVVLLTVVAAIFLIVVVAAVFLRSPSEPPAVAAAPKAPTSAPVDPPTRTPVNPPTPSLAALAITDCNVYRLSASGPLSKAAVIFADGAQYNAAARTARAKLKALSIAVVYDQAYSIQPPWFLLDTAKAAGAQALVQCGQYDVMLSLMLKDVSPENPYDRR